MVADCQYTTGTTITLPIPTGFEFGVIAPNVIGKLMNDIASLEKAFNNLDVKDVYFEITTDEHVEFALKAKNNTQACASAIAIDWATWEANGLQLQANQDQWYKLELNYLLEKLARGEELTIVVSNPSKEMNVDVDATDMSMTTIIMTITNMMKIVLAGVMDMSIITIMRMKCLQAGA